MSLSPPVSETWVKFIPELSAVCGGFTSQELQRWLAGRGVRGAFSLFPPWGRKTLKYSLPAITLLEETLSSLDVGVRGGPQVGVTTGSAKEGLSLPIRMWVQSLASTEIQIHIEKSPSSFIIHRA